jgi:hypothetical protein
MSTNTIDHAQKVLLDILDEKEHRDYEKLVMTFYEIQKKYQFEKERNKPFQLMEKSLDDFIEKKNDKKRK